MKFNLQRCYVIVRPTARVTGPVIVNKHQDAMSFFQATEDGEDNKNLNRMMSFETFREAYEHLLKWRSDVLEDSSDENAEKNHYVRTTMRRAYCVYYSVGLLKGWLVTFNMQTCARFTQDLEGNWLKHKSFSKIFNLENEKDELLKFMEQQFTKSQTRLEEYFEKKEKIVNKTDAIVEKDSRGTGPTIEKSQSGSEGVSQVHVNAEEAESLNLVVDKHPGMEHNCTENKDNNIMTNGNAMPSADESLSLLSDASNSDTQPFIARLKRNKKTNEQPNTKRKI